MIASVATSSYAQNNIGIGTTTPAASAVLDIASTTKGLLIPRMTTAQRTVVASPVTGLLVFDTDTKTLWAYDGAAWKNLYNNGGGSFSLPYSQTVNTAIAALQVSNQGSGAALEGASSNELGIGINAKTTGEYGWGIFTYSSRHGAKSINAFTDSGTVFNGENNYTGNTNTLMSLVNRGLGKTTTVQLTNNSSTSANMQIAGNHLGEQLRVYQTNAANDSAAVSVNNAGTGAGINAVSKSGGAVIGNSTGGIGISGISSTNYGVKGVTSSSTGFAGVHGTNTGTAGSGVVGISHTVNTQGVYGNSNNGIGVRGLSDTYRAVSGTANSGTAIYGSSTTGYALETNGKVKIAGGNTNPVNGAVLTSDSDGNAVWKNKPVGFKVTGIAANYQTVSRNTDSKVHFKTQEYDLGNNFITISENGNTSEGSVFYVPVNGLYHFDLVLNFEIEQQVINLDYTIYTKVQVIRNGNIITTVEYGHYDNSIAAIVGGSTDLLLNAGDKVYVDVFPWATSEETGTLRDNTMVYFSGHLIREL